MSRTRDTVAARQPAPAAAFFFEAATPAGGLWLVLEAGAGVSASCAAEAAWHLGDAEPLLAGLEAWLAATAPIDAPDWRWHAVAPRAPWPAGAVAHWSDGAASARIGLPWALLRRLPAPPPTLAAALRWEPAPALCVLSTLEITPSEQAALEPGAVLLLPASFERTWATTLRADGEAPGPGLAVTLEQPDRPVWRPAAPDKAHGATWEVRCALSTPLCPTQLAGWQPLDDAIALDLRAGLGLWQLPLDASPRRWASGRLLPWGHGQGLWIESRHPWT
ncbi:MAG TPA: hypothetical protein VGQ91_08595 [Ideonella sp.]|jgi:hypothetical protein|nr:hypothetical protein [Ideonella sp.]